MPERFLAVENASVAYSTGDARSQALDNVSLSFHRRTLTLVMGPSGSGKTTLLSVLGCLLRPDSGSVFLNGENVTRLAESARTRRRRRHIGFVFQAFRLFHALSALENLMLVSEIDGLGRRREAARLLLAELGLESKAHLKPDSLSGGEKQRVAIARVLMRNPPVLLADEPTASLDSRAARQISEILLRLAEEEQRAVVVVSHNPLWETFAHRVVELQDGRVVGDRKGAR